MTIEVMQLALEALQNAQDVRAGKGGTKFQTPLQSAAIASLINAIEQAEQEPVAWISDSPTKGNGKQLHFTKAGAWRWSSTITPLYAAPPPPLKEKNT